MGSPSMACKHFTFMKSAATLRRPTFSAPNAKRRDGALCAPWGSGVPAAARPRRPATETPNGNEPDSAA